MALSNQTPNLQSPLTCGNGIQDPNESWDDSNTSDKDGCSSTCTIEAGYECPQFGQAWIDICGDGKVMKRVNGGGNLYWDDGNRKNGDGWDSNWHVEIGYLCYKGGESSKDEWFDVCGDGLTVLKGKGSDYWDDGNNDNGDGWSKECKIEPGYSCTKGSLKEMSIWTPSCGNGVRDPDEECDDQNRFNGDGWDKDCKVEKGFTCEGGTASKFDHWYDLWGDGVIFGDHNPLLTCDDGNKISGDGWSNQCQVEDDWKCSGGDENNKSQWKSIWDVNNCLRCAYKDNQKWVFWDKGFKLQDDFTWKVPLISQAVQEMGSATKLISIVAISAVIGVSLMKGSSPLAIWLVVNQFQLYLLLLLTNVSLPVDVREYIKGNSFFMFSMSFLPFKDSSIYKGKNFS